MRQTSCPRRIVAFAIVVLGAASPVHGGPPDPRYSIPAAVKPGDAVDVTFFGAGLAGATAIWTSFDARCQLAPGIEKNGEDDGKITFRITAAATAEVGVGGVRLASDEGVSPMRLLMVDDLPSARDSPESRRREKAQQISIPSAVDGNVDASQVDFYRFHATTGQRVSVEALAQRVGSRLDPIVRLLEPGGRELAYSDDAPGIGCDSRLAYRFEEEGDYLLEIRDIAYGGGSEHRYRLRVGDFPLSTVPYPMGTRPDTRTSVSIAGTLVNGVSSREVTLTSARVGDVRSLGVRFPQGESSSFVTLLASDLDNTLEEEPNDDPAAATPAKIPGALNGRFEKPKDRDYFRLEARKGERLSFVGRTRRLGSPSDLFLRLHDSRGKMLSEVEDSGSQEGRFDHTFTDDGLHFLMVEDLLRRGGPEHVYRIEVRRFAPGFSLRLEVDKVDAPKDGVFTVKVLCNRRGYDGPVTLSVEGAGDGLELSRHEIPAKKNETVLHVNLPPTIETGTLLHLRIVGVARIGDREMTSVASTLPALRKSFPRSPFPPAGLDGLVGLGVQPLFKDFFTLKAASPVVVVPRFAENVAVRIVAERLDKAFKGPIALDVAGLPAGITAEIKPIAKDKRETVLTLRTTKELVAGTHPLRLRGRGTFRSQPKEIRLEGVTIRVVEPLQVLAVPLGGVKPGKTQKIRVTVLRRGARAAPVKLTWKTLAAGIESAEETIVPADASSVEIEIKAAGDLLPGSFHELAIAAETSVTGSMATAQSAAILVEIAAP